MPKKWEYRYRGKRGRRPLFISLCLLVWLVTISVGVSHQSYHYEKQINVQKKSALFDANHDPLQSELSTADPITLIESDYTWRMYPRAEYQIAARVLHSKQYEDWQAGFSPIDLALGWGMMSDPTVDKWVEVYQENRWYFYRMQKNAPLTLEDVRNSSANVHIIPATAELAALIQGLRPNDVVLMEGKLVDVEVDKSGERYNFKTSLSRFDSEDNSCEIFYVERIMLDHSASE